MAYKGPDISAWQGYIDIKTLAKQVDFFIFKAYAGSSKDSKVDRNVQLAIESGKAYGLYIYSYALNVAQAKEEAKRLVKLANSYSIKPTFLCIDMEDADGYKKTCGMPSNQALKDICSTECEIFEKAGYYAMIYASSSWFKGKLKGLNRYDKWVAHWPVKYGNTQLGMETSPNEENASNCGIWQFTSQGRLNGYNGRLDMNYAYKDFVIKKESNFTPTPKEEELNPITNDIEKYIVKKGDYLIKIAEKYNVNWKDIASLNNIEEPKYIIYTGQVLKIPTKVSEQNTSKPIIDKTIKKGDKVKVLKAIQYSGQAFTTYYKQYDVIEVSGDRIVIGKGKTVTCAINIKNIQKI